VSESESEYVDANRAYWTTLAPGYAGSAERAWAKQEPDWGVWAIPEADVRALPDVEGKDVVELGCGTAYFSAWLARRGARPVGVDVTPAQLETARAMQARHGLTFPLLEASAEDVPLPDASFDLVLSEYGASIWVDPYRWVPEAARLLRPGGELVFLVNGTLSILCAPDDDDAPVGTALERPYFGMHRFSWEGSVEFHLGYGDWIRLLRSNGFEILDLIELRAPEGARESHHAGLPSLEWARSWPSEEIWRARKEA
jgi:SAM-dependent methyltransferase